MITHGERQAPHQTRCRNWRTLSFENIWPIVIYALCDLVLKNFFSAEIALFRNFAMSLEDKYEEMAASASNRSIGELYLIDYEKFIRVHIKCHTARYL